jgi:hypothetical protein
MAPTPVPEPTSSALALTTLAAFSLIARRIHRNRFSTSFGAAV